MKNQKDQLILSKSTSWEMFNDISPRYDFLNHLLSFGLDIVWRKKLIHYLPDRTHQTLLDLATGTADVALTLVKSSPKIQKAYGIDMAEKMLSIGREKIKKLGFDPQIALQQGDAQAIPFDTSSFDVITIAFGIRNLPDTSKALAEMKRVLKNNGRVLILEFSLPKNKILCSLHLFYLRHVVPFIGSLISGHKKAYKYLNQTIETYPYGEAFCQLMADNGFQNVKAHPLLFGIATIYQGDKE